MFARDFLNNEIISIAPNSDVHDAYNLMHKYKVSHLPVVQDDILYLGLLSESDIIYSVHHKEQKNVSDFTLYDDKIHHSQHILDAYEIVNRSNLSLLPVIDEQNSYLGSITLSSLVGFFRKVVAFQAQGAIIEINVAVNDYSASQITQIVESYGVRILSMYVTTQVDTNLCDITLKLNSTEISAIMQSLSRYGYSAHSYFINDASVNNMYSNRIDTLLRFMNI